MGFFGALLLIIVLVLLFGFFMLIPNRPENRKTAAFYGRNYAHRGLYGPKTGFAENSLPAFDEACNKGYGIELDVQLSSDGEVMVFHDDSLRRMCGMDGDIWEYTADYLCQTPLDITEDCIPKFKDVLRLINGRVPIIVELKNGPRNLELCEKTYSLLLSYGGSYCVESFNPFMVRWFKKNAPDVLRGQLSSPYKYLRDEFGSFNAFFLSNLLTNGFCRPEFIAYRVGKKPPLVRLCDAMGPMKVLWTSHSLKNEQLADVVIFEYYLPEPKYKK